MVTLNCRIDKGNRVKQARGEGRGFESLIFAINTNKE
jgi:hypothetical protein